MNSLRNSVRLIGRLGSDPEVKDLGQRKLAKVSLATSEKYRNDKGEVIKETQWHNLVAWGKPADLMEAYLKKGSEIAVEGKLSTRSYTGKDGVKRQTTEVIVADVLFLRTNNRPD